MIPNALADTGPYAGLWGHLKSIDHALARALNETGSCRLTDLDKDRLQALLALLQDALGTTDEAMPADADLLLRLEASRSDYSSALDLRGAIESNQAFEKWQKPSKKAFKTDLERLIKALEAHVNSTSDTLFHKVPRAEFQVLRSIIQSLIANAELALQT